MTRLGIIGGGNMAEALVAGIVRAKLLDPSRILISDVREERLEQLAKKYRVKTTRNNMEVARENETVLIAVKPQHVKEVLDEISEVVGGHQLIISIAAGIPIRMIERRLARPAAVIRVMPNTPALVQEAAAGIALGSHAADVHKEMVITLFNAIGVAVVIDESHMDAVTALSGSGPAYVCLLIEGLVEAGVKEGLDPDVARELAVQTVYGTGRLLSQTAQDPAVLRAQVTSKGGTTEAALEVLGSRAWNQILIEAVHAARVRAEELATSA